MGSEDVLFGEGMGHFTSTELDGRISAWKEIRLKEVEVREREIREEYRRKIAGAEHATVQVPPDESSTPKSLSSSFLQQVILRPDQ